MGNCKSADIKENLNIVKNIISEFVDIEIQNEPSKKYKRLLELLYNLDTYPKETQKLILEMVSEAIKTQ